MKTRQHPLSFWYRLLIISTILICLLHCVSEQSSDRKNTGNEPVIIVVLGSSTAAGTGPAEFNNAWVNRYRRFVKSIDTSYQVINLAKGGYTTYQIMPQRYSPPADKPRPDSNRCITKALSYNPDAIIINLPSNDAANGFSVSEQLANYDTILAATKMRHIPVWITTTQPRNLSLEKWQNLMEMRDSTFARFGEKAIDFWSGIESAAGKLNPVFDCGDGVHLDDQGHGELFDRVKRAGVIDSIFVYRRRD
ncbi:SGNH/GDSL hydrolase family protein [candidate division KSB1 bacterium]|nr:SGNH/GDSL hydrolase family protein [candidate division KSB1 bacterium]